MKKGLLLLFIFTISFLHNSFAWGRLGHDAIACIAECHLTAKAKANVEKYLGHSIVYDASWMDKYRRTPEYAFSTNSHVGAVDKEFNNTPAIRSKKGDVVGFLEEAIERLKDYKNLDDSTVAVNIKYVIHTVGDMHCPVHINYPDIEKNFKVKLLGNEISYHKLWDSGLLEAAHNWSYSEYQRQLDRMSKKERKAVCVGTPVEWFHQSAVDCVVIYDWAKKDAELGQDYVNKAQGLAESQILKAGYRLASVLNALFG